MYIYIYTVYIYIYIYTYIYIYMYIYIYRLIPEKTAECSEMVGVSVFTVFIGPLSTTHRKKDERLHHRSGSTTQTLGITWPARSAVYLWYHQTWLETWVISHVPIEHHPTIRYMVYNGYNGYYKILPGVGNCPILGIYGTSPKIVAIWLTINT